MVPARRQIGFNVKMKIKLMMHTGSLWKSRRIYLIVCSYITKMHTQIMSSIMNYEGIVSAKKRSRVIQCCLGFRLSVLGLIVIGHDIALNKTSFVEWLESLGVLICKVRLLMGQLVGGGFVSWYGLSQKVSARTGI